MDPLWLDSRLVPSPIPKPNSKAHETVSERLKRPLGTDSLFSIGSDSLALLLETRLDILLEEMSRPLFYASASPSFALRWASNLVARGQVMELNIPSNVHRFSVQPLQPVPKLSTSSP